ncbi:hypothetical protein B0H13DRAFT_2380169 [Mycena leptocephala]|nr:hypothetical protein B0H13DRAFT_2380169 [Mycena leptocephala]
MANPPTDPVYHSLLLFFSRSNFFGSRFITKKVRMYPWAQKPPLHPDLHLHPDNPTLRDNNQLSGWFVPNPAQCTLCLKPNLKHRQIPHATFTILTTCPHGTGDDAPHNLSPNKAVAAILPYEDRQYACLATSWS